MDHGNEDTPNKQDQKEKEAHDKLVDLEKKIFEKELSELDNGNWSKPGKQEQKKARKHNLDDIEQHIINEVDLNPTKRIGLSPTSKSTRRWPRLTKNFELRA